MTREREFERERPRHDTRQTETMREIGRFRLINLEHLAAHRYDGRESDLREDLANLRSLVETRTVIDRKANRTIEVAVLTAKGKSMLKSDHREQSFYNGRALFDRFVRPREVFHDAMIYPAYQDAAKRLEAKGATVDRIVLDHELKGLKARETNKPRPGRKENGPLTRAEQDAIARGLQLKVINGKVHIPDLRIEYTDKDGEAKILDLEITTSSYRGAAKAAKAAAGFALCSGSGSGSPVWDDHHLWR